MTVVTPTDCPKLVRNRCVIELFLWRCLCCHFAPFDMSVGVEVFVIGLSQISSSFSFTKFHEVSIDICNGYDMPTEDAYSPDTWSGHIP